MPAGTLENVIVCRASATPAAPCGAGEAPAVMQAYVIDPAGAALLDAASQPYDTSTGLAFWSGSFVFIVSLYLATRVVGQIVNLTR